MRLGIYLPILLLACLVSDAHCETVYFLVAETETTHGDSYVLPLSDVDDIAHARELINGSEDEPIVVAEIECGADCINRDYLDAGKRGWSWHITDFIEFADVTIEILDGWPGLVENDCQGWVANTAGLIGFWSYTVVAELGTDPNHWMRDFFADDKINYKDFARFSEQWFRDNCDEPDWCDGTDLDQSGAVDYNDLRIFAESWLSPFAAEPIEPMRFDCWNCRTQCHGDVNCDGWVSFMDFFIIRNVLVICYPGPCYDPCADFDRDSDVDYVDLAILEAWYGQFVPADCPYCPCCPLIPPPF